VLIVNQMTGNRCEISDHAKRRWAELLTPDPDIMSVRLGRAVPYGGQNGTGGFLIDGDVVFVTNRRNGSDIYDVTTVLPKDYAIANMQAGHHHRLGDEIETTPASNKADVAALAAEIDDLPKLSNEYLVTRHAEAVALRTMVHSSVRRRALGRLMNAIEAEQARRRDVKKQLAHAKLMMDRHKALKQALRESVTEDQWLLICARADEIERTPAIAVEQVA